MQLSLDRFFCALLRSRPELGPRLEGPSPVNENLRFVRTIDKNTADNEIALPSQMMIPFLRDPFSIPIRCICARVPIRCRSIDTSFPSLSIDTSALRNIPPTPPLAPEEHKRTRCRSVFIHSSTTLSAERLLDGDKGFAGALNCEIVKFPNAPPRQPEPG